MAFSISENFGSDPEAYSNTTFIVTGVHFQHRRLERPQTRLQCALQVELSFLPYSRSIGLA